MTKFITLKNNFLVLPYKEETKKIGNIIISGHLNFQDVDYGIVVGISRKMERENEVKIGDKVFFDTFSGVKIKFDDNEYYLFSEREILGIIPEDGKIKVLQSKFADGMMDFYSRTHMSQIDRRVRST